MADSLEEDEKRRREEEAAEGAWAILFGEPRPKIPPVVISSELPIDIGKEAETDIARRLYGLAPRYGNYGVPGKLSGAEGTPVRNLTTPKIYTGGDGTNHGPPAAGGASSAAKANCC